MEVAAQMCLAVGLHTWMVVRQNQFFSVDWAFERLLTLWLKEFNFSRRCCGDDIDEMFVQIYLCHEIVRCIEKNFVRRLLFIIHHIKEKSPKLTATVDYEQVQ